MDDVGRIAREIGEYYKQYSGLYVDYTQWLADVPPYLYEYLHEETYEGRSAKEILEDIDKSLYKNYDALYRLANDLLNLAYQLENPQ